MLVKRQIKNRPKRRRGASTAATGRRKEQNSLEGRLRAIRRNPVTKSIIAQEAELQRRITASAQLTRDFDFLLKKTGWSPNTLLKRLYWDANVMHADRQTVLRKVRAKAWPLDRDTLKATLGNILTLADQVERVNRTDLSPAHCIILRDSRGGELNPRDTKRLVAVFRDLPEILRSYHRVLKRTVNIHATTWPAEERNWSSLTDTVKENSLYEAIRLADSRDQYNSNRLHRLVNAAREVQGLPPIELRAFVKWLNQLRKWANQRITPQAGQEKPAVN
jgi:hypothetical protein